ncbi:HlyD family secretion protein [Rhodopila globiformis]|nr:HlyD family secretion protein [Rhodopila globiformis]
MAGDTVGNADQADRQEAAPHDRRDRQPVRADQPEPRPGKPANQQDRSDHDDDRNGEQKPKRRWPLIILAIVVVAVVILAVVYWLMTRNEETTDDAYTEGNATAFAPKVAGYVTQLNVDDNMFVHKGDLLLRIDPRDYIATRDQARAALGLARAQLSSAQVDLEVARVRAPANQAQAQAQLQQAKANQVQAERDYKRQHSVDPRATTQTSIDQANAQMLSANAAVSNADAQVKIASLVQQTIQAVEDTVKQRDAQVRQAEANLEQAEVNLSYTNLTAPTDGTITRRNVDLGTFLQPGQQVFYIVQPEVWVTANFKETQLADIHPGEPVSISVDAYPSLNLRGHVDSIQQGSGARFSAFPAENATGNFVKIVRRVPVKIIIDHGLAPRQTLPLGLSVEPTVTVTPQ